MRKILLVLATLLVLPSISLAATNVSGTWNAKVDLGSQGGSPTFVLKQDGDKLTGTYSGQLGNSDITGTLKDSTIKFDFQVMGIDVHYEGKSPTTASRSKAPATTGARPTAHSRPPKPKTELCTVN